LASIFLPILFFLASPFWNSYVDFHVKKNREGTSTQATNKQVKEAAREAVGDLRLLHDYRFVTAQSLAVRAEPKARGQALGQLRLGQTVHVLGKERDFTLVAWRSEDGNAELKGWVFSRYLKRFQ
ncbi:MAG: SH3 domain-containing protein, partial [Comamonas sp.]